LKLIFFATTTIKGLDMFRGEIRSQIDAIWNAFWTGGIPNPLEVIEQITYLLFLRAANSGRIEGQPA